DCIRLGRRPPLQLRRRCAKHVSNLERDAADCARCLRARVLPRLSDGPRVVHRRILRQPRLVDGERLGVEIPDPEVAPVTLRLRPLVDAELAEFVEACRSEYVTGLVEQSRLPPDFAARKAERDLAAYEGVIPQGHSFYWIESDGE